MAALFRIKICGITNVRDGLLAAALGADAIGLNFFPRSPRCLALAVAREIAQALPPHVRRVGVFVNAPLESLLTTANYVGLDVLQLHGEEPPQDLQRLGGRTVVRAFRLGPVGPSACWAYLDRCRELRCLPQGILVDAWQPGEYGGTGQVGNWSLARQLVEGLPDLPVILAGGLQAGNVAAAISTVAPAGVDTASGVEASPGCKDPTRLEAFIRQAQQAFAQLPDPACAPRRDGRGASA